VLKIENRAAFDHLPRILLAGLRTPPLGVMVARGDLAVEVGFERLAEVQEEMLWFCEAAHVPIIWATQVLENMAQTGKPSRAEVTDAAMSSRAECVMLNKGPHVIDAVRFLDNVLERMQLHQQKKRSMLRKLSISEIGASDSAKGKAAGAA
jgi:pyruvate kinase